jgi:hypothetical protein
MPGPQIRFPHRANQNPQFDVDGALPHFPAAGSLVILQRVQRDALEFHISQPPDQLPKE